MELANEQHRFPTKEKLNQNFIAYFEKQIDKREGAINPAHARKSS